MKRFVIAAALLALTTPGHAASKRERFLSLDVKCGDYLGMKYCWDKLEQKKYCAQFDGENKVRCQLKEYWPDTPSNAAHATPYQEGIRDYREGLCYRARPYLDASPEQAVWRRGYKNAEKKYPKRDMSHCHAIKEKH